MSGWMDSWIDGWMDQWIDEQKDRWMSGGMRSPLG